MKIRGASYRSFTVTAREDARRRLLRAGGDVKGDVTTLEDLGVFAKLRQDED
jgi:hypothetical protein